MQLIIFDCDGTIVDSQHGIVASMEAAFAAEKLKAPSREEILSIVGLSLREVFIELAPDAPDAVRARLSEGYRTAFQTLRADGHDEALYPGAREVITQLALRDDVVLAIATGKSIRGVARILNQEKWHDVFASIQTADTNPSKPNPTMIEKALAEVAERGRKIDKHRTVMIGDTTFDMAMATSAGVRALGVSWGYHDVADLKRSGAHAIAERFEEVPDFVARLVRG
jgi:phosphoglycolate phosphatase